MSFDDDEDELAIDVGDNHGMTEASEIQRILEKHQARTQSEGNRDDSDDQFFDQSLQKESVQSKEPEVIKPPKIKRKPRKIMQLPDTRAVVLD